MPSHAAATDASLLAEIRAILDEMGHATTGIEPLGGGKFQLGAVLGTLTIAKLREVRCVLC